MIQDLAYSALTGVNAHAIYQHIKPPLGVVLMGHSVGQPSNSGFNPNGKWRISADQLEMAISCANSMGFEAVSMDTVVHRLNGKQCDRPFYALTFDDGYADNLHDALPVCQHYKVPMTVYVTSGFIQRKHVAWWHFIEHLIANNSAIQVTLKGKLSNFECKSHNKKQIAFDQLSKFLTLASVQDQTDFIDEMTQRYGESSRIYAENLFMNETELQEISNNEYAFLGSHGVSHCAFSSLEADKLEQELIGSTKYALSFSGSQSHHLAYPYGSSTTVSARDVSMVVGQGVATAVTTQHGCLYKQAQLQSLPRIPLFPTDTENLLKCKLSGITTLLARWHSRIKKKESFG